jgi:murein DD-endopeptidase MepM/ murein hydrolase activator NlpD
MPERSILMRKVGLDIGDPINREGGQISPTANPDLAGQVAWVRINFMRGPWPSPDDPGWQAAYDEIVNRYVARGIQVYGLVGHDAVLESAGSLFQDDPPNNAQVPQALAWIETYVRNFVSVVEHFQGRVRWFESFNEPNNWHDGRPWVTPYWFAKMLGDLYQAVRLDRRLDVTLVSGPILSHNNNDVENEYSIGSRYLLDTFRAGKLQHGWENIRATGGSYPLDGVGYHLYVDQGPEKSADDIARTLRTYVDSVFRIMTLQDNLASLKKIYISEVGWQSLVGEEKQAENLQVALNTLRNDPRIGAAVWFSTQDFSPNGFGVFRPGLGPGDAKPAYQALETIAEAEPPEPVAPVADGLQFPVGKEDRNVWDDYYVAAFFLDNNYHSDPSNGGAWHPGEDWNALTGGDTDLGAPVYSVAHGRVVVSDHYTPSWGNIVVVEHHLTNGRVVWSQYAHLRERLVAVGDIVSRGQQIGSIGKGDQDKWPAHLHFEIRTRDIPPDIWFPNVRERAWVANNYTNPTAFINSNLAQNTEYHPYVVGEEIIVDSENTDPAAGLFTKAESPYWWSAPLGFRSSTLWTYASRIQEENWGQWRPKLPAAGRYEVFAFIPREHATTRNARYQVNHSGGRQDVIVDQSPHFNEWVSLGIYTFAEGNTGYLRLGDVTGETWGQRREVAFDAAKWVRILNA